MRMDVGKTVGKSDFGRLQVSIVLWLNRLALENQRNIEQ